MSVLQIELTELTSTSTLVTVDAQYKSHYIIMSEFCCTYNKRLIHFSMKKNKLCVLWMLCYELIFLYMFKIN